MSKQDELAAFGALPPLREAGRGCVMEGCQHNIVTSTHERGPHCCQCDRNLVGIFTPVLRDTVPGALMYSLKQSASTPHHGITKE